MSDVDTADRSPRPDRLADIAAVDREKVHPLVRSTAEWSWRLLVIAGAAYAVVLTFNQFQEVLVPVALAVLGAAMLVPVVDALDRIGLPRSVAVLIAIVVVLGLLSAVMTFVVQEFIRGFPDLTAQITTTIDRTRDWLVDGPFGVDREQVQNIGNDVTGFLQHNQDQVTSGALATATTATEIITGALLAFFLLIFFLYGGGHIWTFVTKVIPMGTRGRVRAAGTAGFGTLVGYVRATVAVAFVDALGIGVGLAILGVPLALPLASLVFLGAFIPIVGALVTGTLAVLVALVTQGWIAAVIALAIVIGVMQVESHVLQPFLLGRSVRLHPVAVVLGIAAGIVSAGIIGGLLAVPLIAFLNTAIRHLNGSAASARRRAARADRPMYSAEPDEPHWDLYDDRDAAASDTAASDTAATSEQATDEQATDEQAPAPAAPTPPANEDGPSAHGRDS
ncbi:AI-2E family transporter [Gordonia sp. HNM0687]|uniref:AI-2E family transporter n=1 Tax=Gordonia mangrovi TaxID=2665643 RepID=A0A6L7GPQ6_9ACTN|nr:AI-2E family transporter [Gordonia mangrovi]MDY6808095.1 AI-2E family transporter [Actinomycetota bacterium]MXP21914.1 AI-2E family transporter [Gordonia mangrovi]UVF76279.1 AI-2E family transporter [Gordonia mangrovi]